MTISEDTHIIDLGEVENAEILIKSGVVARYTVVPNTTRIVRHIRSETGVDFIGKGIVIENTDAIITTEVIGDQVSSDLNVLAIATTNSDISVEGVAKVAKPYKKINIRVDQINILIGQDTRVRGVPKLEIETNDIEGGHSCKIHRLGGDALFYLESHGLDTRDAESMLLDSEILSHLVTLPENLIPEFSEKIRNDLKAKK